jgi:hypothetical protein
MAEKRERVGLHLGACDGRFIDPDDGGDDLERVSQWYYDLFSVPRQLLA